jgi:drug/metabolite transporter (DMT)-like permease
MLTGIALFSINDALGKWLLATYSVGELLLVRSATALLLLAPFVYRVGIPAFRRAPRPALQLVRIVLSTLEVAMFFWAVSYLPLADTVTFYLAGPIYVTALSVLLLGERVGWRRWTAVLLGFAGVLLALRPSAASLTLPALIALTGSIFFALLMIATRLLRTTPNTVLVGGQILGTLMFGLVTARHHRRRRALHLLARADAAKAGCKAHTPPVTILRSACYSGKAPKVNTAPSHTEGRCATPLKYLV